MEDADDVVVIAGCHRTCLGFPCGKSLGRHRLIDMFDRDILSREGVARMVNGTEVSGNTEPSNVLVTVKGYHDRAAASDAIAASLSSPTRDPTNMSAFWNFCHAPGARTTPKGFMKL
jgi:hypothetical protein